MVTPKPVSKYQPPAMHCESVPCRARVQKTRAIRAMLHAAAAASDQAAAARVAQEPAIVASEPLVVQELALPVAVALNCPMPRMSKDLNPQCHRAAPVAA